MSLRCCVLRLLFPALLGGVVLGLTLAPAAAQDRDRRSGFDPRDLLRRMDDNNNNLIDPSELSDRSRGYLAEAAKRAGLDMGQPMPVDRLLSALEKLRDEMRSGDSGGDRNSSGSSNSSGSGGSNSSSSVKPPAGLSGFGAPAGGGVSGFSAPGAAASNAALEARFDKRVLEYVDGMLRDYDKNRDGFVDSIEWQSGRWRDPPETSDTNKDNRLSKEELCVRIAARYGASGGSSSGSGGSSTSSSSTSSGGSSSSGSGGASDVAKYRSYAESLLKQYDKNKNGYLEKDEWSEMKSEHRAADLNADAVITLDELTNRLQAYASGGSSATPSSASTTTSGTSSSTPGGSSSSFRGSFGSRGYGSTPGNPADRKSYRVATATERLPKGLPDWFLRGDADGDGQVKMVEYAASWNEETAAQFLKYDLNGDGIITPAECLSGGATK